MKLKSTAAQTVITLPLFSNHFKNKHMHKTVLKCHKNRLRII